MSLDEVKRAASTRRAPDLVLLDVREQEAFRAGHLPGARHVPRGELELRADRELPDPTARILTYCQYGKVSTLAAQTLRTMGYLRAVALDGGVDAWQAAGHPLESGPAGRAAQSRSPPPAQTYSNTGWAGRSVASAMARAYRRTCCS